MMKLTPAVVIVAALSLSTPDAQAQDGVRVPGISANGCEYNFHGAKCF